MCLRYRVARDGRRRVCVDVFDQMNCNAAFNFCAAELMAPYNGLGEYFITSFCTNNGDDDLKVVIRTI